MSTWWPDISKGPKSADLLYGDVEEHTRKKVQIAPSELVFSISTQFSFITFDDCLRYNTLQKPSKFNSRPRSAKNQHDFLNNSLIRTTVTAVLSDSQRRDGGDRINQVILFPNNAVNSSVMGIAGPLGEGGYMCLTSSSWHCCAWDVNRIRGRDNRLKRELDREGCQHNNFFSVWQNSKNKITRNTMMYKERLTRQYSFQLRVGPNQA